MRSLVSLITLLSVAQALSFPGLLGRSISDTCASIDDPLKLPIGRNTVTICVTIRASLAFFLTFKTGGLTIDCQETCLCLLGIPDFINHNSIAKLAVSIVGKTPVTSALTALVVNLTRE